MGLTPIERDGDALWRPDQPWNQAVHALLTHLHGVGCHGAPRSLGFDRDGRHKLTWVKGDAGRSSGEPDDRLVSSAQLIRGYHEAVRGFAAPAGLQVLVGAPVEGPIVCHNDLGPVNTVFSGARAVALIDWDLAGPGDERWDLAYAAYRSVPLYDDEYFAARAVAPPDRGHRLRLFVDAYGLDDRGGFVDVIAQRVRSLYETAKSWGGDQGQPGWADVWRDTRGRQWLATLDFLAANAVSWQRSLSG